MKSFFASLFSKKEAQSTDRLFFIETNRILDKTESRSGLITGLEIEKGSGFIEFNLSNAPHIVNKRRGTDLVLQDLELKFSNYADVHTKLKTISDRKSCLSILHIDSYNNAYLYGENEGLEITELSEDTVLLEGEEADTFFKVDSDLSEILAKG